MRCGYLAGLAVVGLLSSSCTPDFATQDESQVILRITKIVGDPGSEDQEGGDVLFSDVCCGIINDNAILTFQALPKNANLDIIDPHNDVFLERYEVVYFRSDGRNTEGVDVPYRITGPMAVMLPADLGTFTDASIVVVRHQAKLEPPLKNLRNADALSLEGSIGGGQVIITAIAEITVHGRTTSGKAVTATGRLQISFADFAGEG
jgi:hypothetical protein